MLRPRGPTVGLATAFYQVSKPNRTSVSLALSHVSPVGSGVPEEIGWSRVRVVGGCCSSSWTPFTGGLTGLEAGGIGAPGHRRE